jgi:hypothetical protein
MGWIEPVSTVVTAVSMAKDLANASGTISTCFSRFAYWLKNGKVVVPIFGAGGVGKTTLGQILGGAKSFDIDLAYDESLQVDPVKLGGPVTASLLVAPGQVDRVPRHWPELFRAAGSDGCLGVINLVCYGYHSFAIQSYREHDLYLPNATAAQFMSEYTKVRRNLELEMMQRLVDGLAAIDRPFWMITVVNKQDLWWPERTAVKAHYNGRYLEIVNKVRDALGAQNFQHEFIPASLVMGNLKSPSGEELAPTAGGYDQLLHLRHMEVLLSNMNDLIARGLVQ